MSCLVIAGEKSGEEHALGFYDKVAKLCPQTSFYGVGGDDLIARGFEAIYHLNDFSSLGISEVFPKLGFYLRALKVLEKEVIKRNTKTAILIDFQEFNLILAKRLKKKGVRVLYYVAPQAWAWRPGRAKTLAKTVHSLFTIVPFEQKWFQARGVKQVIGVKHPLIAKYQQRLSGNQKILQKKFPNGVVRVLLLPGSRKPEVTSLLSEFLWAVSHLEKDYKVEVNIVRAKSVDKEIFELFPYNFTCIYREEELADALEQSDICLAASGTVTLCCALFQVPTIVAYKVNLFNEIIFRIITPYQGPFCLANIIYDGPLFPEFLQLEANGLNMLRTMKYWLTNREDYERIRARLKLGAQNLSRYDFNVAQHMSSVICGKNDD